MTARGSADMFGAAPDGSWERPRNRAACHLPPAERPAQDHLRRRVLLNQRAQREGWWRQAFCGRPGRDGQAAKTCFRLCGAAHRPGRSRRGSGASPRRHTTRPPARLRQRPGDRRHRTPEEVGATSACLAPGAREVRGSRRLPVENSRFPAKRIGPRREQHLRQDGRRPLPASRHRASVSSSPWRTG